MNEQVYTQPSDEVVKQIEAMFDSPDTFKFETRPDGYYIETKNMYEYVGFNQGVGFLSGMHKIATLLGVNEGDEFEKWNSPGCETCDYGSSYHLTWRFWRTF